ncbi:MAG: VWA domain-containing protein [Polyangia bacterium]
MFVDFLYELRRTGVRVGAQEALALADALGKDLHGTSLDGFYDVARSLLVHREGDLDAFDAAFSSYFHGIELRSAEIADELLEWLRDPVARKQLTDEEKAMLESLDLDELKRRFRERLAEQKERHDGGNRWIGTGGTSPFGRGGYHPTGMSVGDGPSSGVGAMARASMRTARGLRADRTVDVRQIELALRRLRAFVREGAPTELDLDATIDATAKNAGELEVVTRAVRRPALRVVLLLDVGGSMEPHVSVCERLFSAARKATHWKRLEVYYFHNCVYSHLYPTSQLTHGIPVDEVIAATDPSWKLIVVGDALMHPSELFAGGSSWTYDDWSNQPGIAWLQHLQATYRRAAWLNPEPEAYWRGTAATVARLFPMFRLSLEGLSRAVQHLNRAGSQ